MFNTVFLSLLCVFNPKNEAALISYFPFVKRTAFFGWISVWAFPHIFREGEGTYLGIVSEGGAFTLFEPKKHLSTQKRRYA